MAEAASSTAETNTPKAPKDKNCPYCGQAFTSSSLGRHLDLYIKEKNPKPPDGIHDVDAIRKLRGNITRRQPRASLRRETSTPTGTPTAASRKSPVSDADSSQVRSPVLQRDSQSAADLTKNLAPFTPRWEATGVINDIPAKGGEAGEGTQDAARRTLPQRAVSRQMVKAQFDMKQKVQDALDTAKAAELALREMIGSWRAAKQHIDVDSLPFDFEPLSLDFPALCLQCLKPPPTLFSSTQHPTPTSWSITSPGQKQFEALKAYFQEEFRRWKVTCAAATTAVVEELTYPPTISTAVENTKDAVRRAEKQADTLEKQVTEHLQSAFSVWEQLSPQRRQELWVLELARSVGRKQKEVDKLKESHHSLRQENANLKSQIEHLNRLQQPREFKIMSPTTVPVGENMVQYMLEEGVTRGRRGVGLHLDDRHLDLSTVVSTAIDRWKNVIVSARSASGMSAQRPLDQAATPGPARAQTPVPAPTPAPTTAITNPSNAAATPTMQQQSVPQPQPTQSQQIATAPTPQQQPQGRHMSVASSTGPTVTPSEPKTSAAPTPSVASVDDEMSDQDADAEMEDDDGFAAMNTPAAKPPPPPLQVEIPQQQTQELHVPRARGPAMNRAQQARFALNGRAASHVGHGRGGMNMRGQVGNMNAAAMRHATHGHMAQHQQHQNMQDLNMMQGVSGTDQMYLD